MAKSIISSLLQEKNFSELKKLISTLNEVDLANLLEELDEKEMIIVFRLLDKEKAALTFSHLNGKMQELLIVAFTERELKDILEEMFLDDTIDLLEEMPANVVERIISASSPQSRASINTLLNYPKDSAGSMMTVEYADLKKGMTVGEAIAKLRRVGIDKETIYTCYVIEQKKLIGIVSVKDLLVANDSVLIEDIMETNLIFSFTCDDQEKATKKLQKYGFLALPIVDKEQRMVGIITYDDAMDVLQEETDEDLAIMSGMKPNEESYFNTPIWVHAKNRILWLLVLMLSATITGSIITKYQNAFAAIPILVSFIPMLMGTGGNSGSQSSTMIIRGLALEEIRLSDFLKVAFNEFRIGLIVGVLLAAANGLRIFIIYRDPMLALLLALSLVATVITAKLIGSTLPILATKCRLDPAIMSAPLITTLVDTLSILIYFQIATHLFAL